MEDSELREACNNAIKAYPDDVRRYKTGKAGLMGLFTGHVMKETKGRADPKLTISTLTEMLLTESVK